MRAARCALAASFLEREAFKVNPQHFVSTVLLFLLAIGVKAQTFAAGVEQPDRLAASNGAPRSFVDGSIFIGHGGVPAGADN
jgi:hypothetical protein